MDVLTYLYRYLKEQSVRYTVAGINHFIWLTELERNGEDLIPEVRNFAATHHEIVDENKAHQSGNPFQGTHGVKLMLCRRFGYMPLVGDRHLVEFMPTLCNVRNGYAMQHGVSKTTVDFRRLQKLRQLAEVEQLASGQEKPDWTVSDEPLREIMRAIITGEETETIANTPNVGQLEGLPEGAIVETICTVSKDSIRPHPSGRLPFGIEALVKLHIEVQNLTYEAAMEGSRDKLVQAMTLDPLSAGADFEEIADLTDELIAANREWLPRFA
jgi:alpha-galactosidase